MSKIKFSRSFIALITVLLTGIFAVQSFAQANSPGCNTWNGIGSVTLAPNVSSGMISQNLFAGETLRATFTLATPGTATVSLSGSGMGIDIATFSSGSVALNLTVPSDGVYANVLAGNSAGSSASVNVTYSCNPPGGANAGTDDYVEAGFGDGRINFRDAAAPIAVYPYRDTNGSGFDIYNVEGAFLLRVTADDLLNLPIVDSLNTITVRDAFGDGYRVTAPQYNGKTYILEFVAPVTGIGYTSWEED